MGIGEERDENKSIYLRRGFPVIFSHLNAHFRGLALEALLCCLWLRKLTAAKVT